MRFVAVPVSFSLLAAGCQVIAGGFEIGPAAEQGGPCYPGEVTCSKGKLQRCGAGRRFETAQDCGSEAACDPSAQACRACAPGEYACQGKDLTACEAGTWVVRASCASADLCSVSATRDAGSCGDAICAEGEHRCEGSRLLRCSKTRAYWELLEICASERECDAGAADAQVAAGERGRCSPACSGDACGNECQPGNFRCTQAGAIFLERCSADGYWQEYEACISASLCDATEGRCLAPACRYLFEERRMETRCTGQDFEQCSGDQTRFERRARCSAGQTCDPVQGCVPQAACTTGNARCNSRTYERCEDGVWKPYLACAEPELCNVNGGCTPPSCFTGTYRCEGGNPSECTDGRDGWNDDIQLCKMDETCTAYPETVGTFDACLPS